MWRIRAGEPAIIRNVTFSALPELVEGLSCLSIALEGTASFARLPSQALRTGFDKLSDGGLIRFNLPPQQTRLHSCHKCSM